MKTLSVRATRTIVSGALMIALGVGAAAQRLQINGAGATFPYPIYSKWFS